MPTPDVESITLVAQLVNVGGVLGFAGLVYVELGRFRLALVDLRHDLNDFSSTVVAILAER